MRSCRKQIKTPVCLDESIHSAEDARTRFSLVRAGSSTSSSAASADMRKRNAWNRCVAKAKFPVWCGGMLESGIGRAHNIAMATLAGFTLPGDVSASSRYWEEDIIEPAVTVTSRGTIVAPEKPGIGFDVNVQRVERLTVRKEIIK